jgi:CRP-like cAMP-binding protein
MGARRGEDILLMLRFRVSDIEADCPGVSRDMIRHLLRGLRDQGVLRAEGRGRAARWIKQGER